MAPWLLGFVAGISFGRAGVSSLTLIFVPLMALSFAKTKPAATALFCLGVGWGFANAAPTFVGDIGSARVIRSSSSLAAPRAVIVDVGGERFEAAAPAGSSGTGMLRFKPQAQAFGPGRSAFVAATQREASDSLFARTVVAVRGFFHRRLERDRPFMRDWLKGVLLGERAVLPRRVTEAFKLTGTYHLLAVSGLHVSMLVVALSFVLRAPFQAAYALRLMGPGSWRHVASGLNVVAGVLALVYLGICGMPAAAQRAALTYLVVEIGAVTFGVLPLGKRLQVTAVLQTVFFPLGLLSEGAIMSWAAYLLVASGLRGRLLITQAKLTVMAAAAFGQLPLLGIVANLFLVPVFSLLLVLGLFAVLLGPDFPGRRLVLELHASFIEIVIHLAALIDRWPWLSLAGDRLPVVCPGGFWILSAIFLLNTCRNLSIDQSEREDIRCLRDPGSEKAW